MRAERLPTIDALRGLASLAVCWFHLTNGNERFLPAGPLKTSGEYGWAGVEVFFVLSGFVIPHALSRGKYRLADFGRFALKRITRLDPPYLVNIALVLVLGYLSSKTPGFEGSAFSFEPYRTALHLAYLNAFSGQPWLNPVYWTLAIEFQYYLLMGLFFPLIQTRYAAVLAIAFCALGVYLPKTHLIFHFAALFLMGIVTFRFKERTLSKNAFFFLTACLVAISYASLGLFLSVLGAATALAIAFARLENPPLLFLGAISYSLYLIHVPIGGRLINLSLRLDLGLAGKGLVLLMSLAVAILTAYFFYVLVERPSQRLSARIDYRRTKRALAAGREPLECARSRVG